ncbi:hypothetical protein [Winogradskyella sp.]|uniref:hypothetical protein n=1 Tax=Winogradskyella sp. TaxID=1883156 RepID=UPI003BA8BE07
MKKIKKVALSIAIILILLIVWGYFHIWRSPKFYLDKNTCDPFERVLTMEEYRNYVNSHERPYVYNKENILVFGSEHTKNPNDPQIGSIEIAFKEFKPTTVLVEGRLGFLIPYAMDPILRFGEMGKVGELANKNSIPMYSWDTPKNELLKALQEKFEPEQIALKEILTPYFGNLRFGKPESPEKYVEQYLFRAEWLGVQDKIKSIKDIDRIWKRDFSTEKDWRDTSDQWGLPGYLSEIADHSNFIRNQHLVCTINQLLSHGERLFVICGSSHAVCIKDEIKSQI